MDQNDIDRQMNEAYKWAEEQHEIIRHNFGDKLANLYSNPLERMSNANRRTKQGSDMPSDKTGI